MTFYERFLSLCNPRKPNPVASEIGVSSASVTKWKYGAIPDGNTIKAIATYFGCTSDYLLGLSDTPTASTAPTLTADEAELLFLFRALPYKLQQRYIGRMQESADDEARAAKKDA